MPLLNKCDLIAFAATLDMAKAKQFYGDKLGLRLVTDDGYASVFDANGTMLRVVQVRELARAPYTVLGWKVGDIAAAVAALRQDGVEFERFAGLDQDELGIWSAPVGMDRVAWFKDPDGNVLSVSQHG